MPDSNEFRFRNRGETLEYRRGAHIFHFDVTWSLHVRLFVDPDLVTVECRRVDATERRAVLNEVLDFLRTQSQDPSKSSESQDSATRSGTQCRI